MDGPTSESLSGCNELMRAWSNGRVIAEMIKICDFTLAWYGRLRMMIKRMYPKYEIRADSKRIFLRHLRSTCSLAKGNLEVNVVAIANTNNPNRREKVQFVVQVKAMNREERAIKRLAIGLKNL